MLDLKNFKLETERLVLIPVSLDYAAEIFKEFTTEITKYMFPETPEKIEETEDFIKKSNAELLAGKTLNVVILDRQTQEFLGCSGLNDIDTRQPEPGIWVKKSAHGKGYGFEAVKALAYWAEENLDYDYLLYPADVRNLASCKIAEKLGGQLFNKRDFTKRSGFVLHLADYKIVKN